MSKFTVKDLIKELESGKYPKGKDSLVSYDKLTGIKSYCCLGVMAKMCGYEDAALGEEGILSAFPEVVEAFGLHNSSGTSAVIDFSLGYQATKQLTAINDMHDEWGPVIDALKASPEAWFKVDDND